MPPGSRPVAILCLGRVDEFYPRPMLETAQWRARADLSSLVFDDRWPIEDDACPQGNADTDR
jgi:5,6-dimethylbenzimidazole synthase